MSAARVRLDGSDKRFALVCMAVMAAGAAIALSLFSRAFPEASLDFKVTREQARAIAARELTARGFDVAGYRELVAFDHDDEAKVFLERTLGLKKANALFGTTVPIWRWSVRFVKPLSKLELRAHVSPDGQLVGYRRVLPEADAAPDPGEAAARALAETALRKERGIDPAALRFMETTTEKRPSRVDRGFVWESNEVRFGDAALRYQVEVQGDRVGRLRTFLEVPQKWKEEYKTLRSKNEVAGAVATFGLFLTMVAILVVLVQRIQLKDVRWRWAMAFGVVGMVLKMASDLNELPLTLFNYETTQGWGAFLGQVVVGQLGGSVLLGVVVALLVAAGEPLYRERYPERHALGRIFSRRGVQSRAFFRGILLGYALAAFFMAYQVIFYLVAEKFGAWAPADVPYTNLLGTKFPWLAVLLMGFMPATTEEFSSRMFSIPFLERWLPRWAAVVIPAFIWGFAHAAYPNQPFWIRGVEVGVAGVIIGATLIRAGIFPLLVWHFAVDAIYTSLLLLRSSNTYFVVSGAFSAAFPLVPLAICLWLYRRNGGFVNDPEISNAAEGSAPLPEHAPRSAPGVAGTALPLNPGLAGAVALLAIALLAVSRFVLPHLDWGKDRYRLDRKAARAAADGFLKRMGDDPAAYMGAPFARTALPSIDGPSDTGADLVPYDWSSNAERWLAERGGAPLVASRARTIWQVRYVRPLDLHGAWVVVDAQDGRVLGFKRTFPDAEGGASLEEPAARAVALELLRSFQLDTPDLAVVSVTSENKKARRDWRLTYESKRGDGVPTRVVVELAGDKPALLASAPKLPETWVRAHEKWTAATWAALVMKVLGLGALFGLLLAELFRVARSGRVPWKRYAALAALLSIASVGRVVAAIPNAIQAYRTEIPMQLFAVVVAIGSMIGVMLVFGAALVVLALAGSLRPDLTAVLSRPRQPGRSLLAAAAAVLLLAAAASFQGSLESAWPVAMGVNPPPKPAGIDALVPFFDLLEKAVLRFLVFAAAASVLLSVFRTRFVTAPARLALLALLGLGVAPIGARSWTELFVPWLGALVAGAALIVAILVLLEDDVLAWALAAAALVALRSGLPLLLAQPALWRLSGALSLALVAIVAAWTFLRSREPQARMP